MSDRRRFKWKSGRLANTPISEFLHLPVTLDASDPSIPNLPLLDQTSGPTIVSGSFSAAGTSAFQAQGAVIASSSFNVTGQAAFNAVGASLNTAAFTINGTSTVNFEGSTGGGTVVESAAFSAAGSSTVTAETASIGTAEFISSGSSTVQFDGTTAGAVTIVSAAFSASGTSDAEFVGTDGQTRQIYGGKVHELRAKRNRQIEAIIKGMAPEVMDYFKRAA